MKRKIALFLMAAFILLTILSCAQTGGDQDEREAANIDQSQEAPEQTEPEDMFRTLGDRDFGGYEFRFLVLEAGINDTNRFVQEIFVEEQTGDTIDDAVYLRNAITEDRYNVKITAVISPSPEADARRTIRAGDNAYDMVNLYKGHAMTLGAEGLFKNFHDLEHVDFNAPWWSSRCAEGLSIMGKLYNMSGSILISEIDDTLAMIFNKKLLVDHEIEDLYSLVSRGYWTLDRMIEIVRGISADLNGDGIHEPKYDLFGYAQDPYSMAFNWVFSSDLLNGYIDDGGIYNPNVNIERVQLLVDKLRVLFSDQTSAYTGLDLYEGLTYFEENRIFLYAVILRNLELLRAMEVDFGVLPYPKLDEAQKNYITHVGASSSIMCISGTNDDNERTGFILEAMSIASHDLVTPAYYDIALKTKFARDDDSSEMLDIILESRIYDLSYYAGQSLVHLVSPIITRGDSNFASVYERQGERTFASLQRVIDKIIAAE